MGLTQNYSQVSLDTCFFDPFNKVLLYVNILFATERLIYVATSKLPTYLAMGVSGFRQIHSI